MGALKATTISTSKGAMKLKPVPRISLSSRAQRGTSQDRQRSLGLRPRDDSMALSASQVELEGFPLLVHGLAVRDPPLGILEVLDLLVLRGRRELPELVPWQQLLELGAGAGVGDHLGSFRLILRQRHLVHQLVGCGFVLRLGALDDAEVA